MPLPHVIGEDVVDDRFPTAGFRPCRLDIGHMDRWQSLLADPGAAALLTEIETRSRSEPRPLRAGGRGPNG